jgi:hypothetical protein
VWRQAIGGNRPKLFCRYQDEYLMMTMVVWMLLAAGVLAVGFRVAAPVVGMRAAFLAACWLPMAGVMLTIGLHHHLGYSGLAALGMTLAASAGLTCLGARLIATARREKNSVAALVAGTAIASLPLVLFGGWWVVNF